eukprot:TRINITY_DN7698_c0_g1_i1.p1 TRINITY_DN7698_c0_g1~~TRINITY_DN7698_c0_g1_i1.p1  ORF type:complete len:1103 (+),score=325.60 TRINITY_DN7698_c0_g1_i1:65-3310(+)
MSQKCGGRPLTEEQIAAAVVHALALEAKKEARRLPKEVENLPAAKETIEPLPELEAIVNKNAMGAGNNSLSQVEWLSMEAAMPPEERQTHRNLGAWLTDRAKAIGVKQEEDDEDDGAEDAELLKMLENGTGEAPTDGAAALVEEEEEEPEKRPGAPTKKEEEEDAANGTIDKAKNWSAVNAAFKESKLSFRGSLTPVAFTNWLWYRCVRPKLEETKAKLPELDLSGDASVYCIDDVEEIFGEFMPAMPKPKEEKDKKDKDKKDKKEDKDKKDKKDKKDDKKDDKKKDDKKKKKDQVTLNAKEKLQVQNLIKNMIFGESGKGKTIVTGWVNMIEEKDIGVLVPWEFQIAHVMRQCMALEYKAKKAKENPDSIVYYEMVQALADAIATVRKQYKHEFEGVSEDKLLPMQDALTLQERFRSGSVGTLKFDLLWYLQNGAHLISGSSFTKKHKSTVFKPFKIQEQMVDAILSPGPQLIFGIAPPGTGKTAVVSHLLNLFPGHSLVFCCAALPVVLGVGRIANSLGVPYAFVKGRRLTPSFACGRGLGTHTDMPATETSPAYNAIESMKYKVCEGNLLRKQKRLAEKKRLRNLHNLKRNPKMYLMCDTSSCAWLLRQLDANRTILVIDEPPMGSDVYPDAPENNPLAAAMVQSMLTPMYKSIWMSATLPRSSSLSTFVDNFMERFSLDPATKDQHVRECFSTELDRGALMCGPSGAVAFPHQKCRTAEDLGRLCKRLPLDPLVLKAYTERALANLLERWKALKESGRLGKEGFKKAVPPPEQKFADLSELNHASIRAYAMDILDGIASQGEDDLVVKFCEATEGGAVFPAFNLVEMMFSNAYAFPGLTLVAGDDPKGAMLHMSSKLRDVMPKAQDIEDDIKAQEAAAAKAEKYAEDGEVMEGPATKLKFNAELVIQSESFLKRWCPNRPKDAPTIVRLLPTVKEFLAIKELPIEEMWQMLAVSGAGSFDPKLDVDPANPVYTQWVHEAMTANRLACVTAGKEFTWGANVPASTVVVTQSFAETTSVAGMLQYVGRAARRGLTTHGQAIFERDEDLFRIFDSPDGLSTEALTMERFAIWWRTRGKTW